MFLSFLRCVACPREGGEQESFTKIPDRVRDGRSKKWFLLPFAVLAFFISMPCFGRAEFQIPEKPDGYVADRAALLTPQTRAQIENFLGQFEAQTSNQILVATFPSLDGGSLEDISIHLAQKWQPGQKERDNGVLFLVFRDDRQMRIEVGYGLEGVLTDALAAQIIRNEITPYFRTGDYEAGIVNGLKAILAATRNEYQALPRSPPEAVNEDWVKMIFGIIGIVFALDILRYAVYRGSHQNDSGRYGFWEWFFLFAILWLILRVLLTSRGGGSWSSSGGRGGGFSGGGGSFGGGGASGRW